MSEQSITRSAIKTPERFKVALLALAALVWFVVFTIWGGAPGGERALPFWTAVAVLLVVLAGFAWATWHLLFRPLPAGHSVRPQPIKASYLQAIALLLSAGGFGIIVGAFWDEVWHRQYGLPFGEDFFWRPHLLMYFGFAAAAALAFAGLYLISRKGQGTFQQRFRANPVIGLLILAGGFLMYVLPADPIWHGIIGPDLSAWSIPHLLLVVSFVSILLLSIAIHLSSTQPRPEWGALLRLSDVLPLLMFAATSLMWNQFFTTEWDSNPNFVAGRPEWLLPVLIAGGAAFIGVMANHTLRRVGAATLAGALGLALRYALIRLFSVENMMQVNAWVLALPSLVLIDLWYAYRPGAWKGAGVAAALGMGLALLTIFDQVYPAFAITNFPITLVMVLLGSLGVSWLGASVGDYLAEGNKQEAAAAESSLSLASLGVTAAMAAFVVFFVTTATPPA